MIDPAAVLTRAREWMNGGLEESPSALVRDLVTCLRAVQEERDFQRDRADKRVAAYERLAREMEQKLEQAEGER